MKIKRIVFLIESKFNQRDYKRFGFQLLQERGYEVHAWDFTYQFRYEAYNNYSPPAPIEYRFHFEVRSPKDFYKLLDSTGTDTIFIVIFGHRSDTKYVFAELTVKNYEYGFISAGSLPLPSNGIVKKIRNNLIDPYKLLKKLIFRLDTTKPSPGFVITGGRLSADEMQTTYPHANIIRAHSLDYDLYLSLVGTGRQKISNNKYAVFLDEFVPYHPDYYYMGVKPDAKAELYYQEINSFFDSIEENFNLRVIIAAHPRSDYINNNYNPYNNREILFGKTPELIKESSLTLTHESTAKSFAVLFRKPLIFISSSNYSERFNRNIRAAAESVGQVPINISSEFNLNSNIKADWSLYSKYIENYIKEKNTVDKPVWDIFADYCDSIA